MFAVINGTSVFSCVVTILNIAMERFLATVLHKSYEVRGSTIGIAILTITILLGVFVSASSLGYDIYNGTYDIRTSRESCLSVRLHPETVPFAWIVAFFCCLFGTIIIVKLYYYNRRQRKRIKGISLSTRYQYNENMVTTRALLPAVGGYIFFVVPGCVLSTYIAIIMLKHGDRGLFVQILIQILYLMSFFYQIFFIVYVSIKYPPLFAQVRRDFRRLFREKSARIGEEGAILGTSQYITNPTETTKTYFIELDKCWNQDPARKN
ncbi:serpentine type 7TM GPCR receptor class ab chemoreceptor domain-containing protein [Ditylenchus destructor]|nr:serpentine type 7TM GPCR receptor class ab chemoreceptor domain-containing protein [Ditylenchus destructor]